MMHRLWGLMALALMTTAAAEAATTPGVISGMVKNSTGAPQRSALVQIFAAAATPLAELRTDERGRYKSAALRPGSYTVKVTAPSYLPTIRERVLLRSGASVIVNLTLNTLFEAIQMAPRRGGSAADRDDWRWTLRSMANRPILRLVDDGPLVVVHDGGRGDDGVLKARVSFMAGDGSGYGAAGAATNFQIESTHLAAGRLGLSGRVSGNGGQAARLRAGYAHELPNGSTPEIGLSLQRYASPELAARRAALEAMAMRISNNAVFGRVEAEYGGLLQQAELNGGARAMTLFASARAHLGENAYLGFASTGLEVGEGASFETPFLLNRGGYDPRVTQAGGRTRIERGRRNETTLAVKRGRNRVQVGYYSLRARDMALQGAGSPSVLDSLSTANLNTESFLLNGGDHRLSGYNVVYERKVNDHLTLTGVYDRGDVLTAGVGPLTLTQLASSLRAETRNSAAVQARGVAPATRTSFAVSYRWTGGEALSNVNAYAQGVGAIGPKLNLQLRQPLPLKLTQCSVEVMVDVRNLLAEGYRPVLSSDGSTLYLAPIARSISGGLSFTF